MDSVGKIKWERKRERKVMGVDMGTVKKCLILL